MLNYCQRSAITFASIAFAASLFAERLDQLGSAVDAAGIQHQVSDYHGKTPPWTKDATRRMGPDYPFYDRRARHQGTGLFRITIKLATGTPESVTIVRSTGTTSLDRSALIALRQWRWKPSTWKEVVMPVTFVSGGEVHLSRDAIPLPHP